MSSVIKVDQIQLANGSTPTAADLGLNTTGNVLQVVQASVSSQYQNSSTNTYVSTGLSATITPTSSTSKILVVTTQAGNTVGDPDKVDVRLLRDGSELTYYRQQVTISLNSNDHRAISYHIKYLDSPATTSAVTYSTEFRKQSSAGRLDVQKDGSDGHMILMEIAGE